MYHINKFVETTFSISDEGAESLAAIKRRYQHAPYGVGERERSYSESDDEREEVQRKTIAEAKIDSEDEEMETSDTVKQQTLDNKLLFCSFRNKEVVKPNNRRRKL